MERLLSSAFSSTPGNHTRQGRKAAADSGDECRAAMRQVIEAQVMPRLLQVTRQAGDEATSSPLMGPSIADVEAFAQTCAAGDRAACHALVQRLQTDGLKPEHLLVDLVAPAARHLGERWDEDTLDFTPRWPPKFPHLWPPQTPPPEVIGDGV